MKNFILFFVIFTLAFTMCAYAQKTVTLTLTDNTNPVGTKYYCYHKMTGGTYSAADRKDLSVAKTYAWLFVAPVALGTHYFACTAYMVDGAATLESGFSNDYTWVNLPVAPTITGTVAAVSRKEATLLASTTKPTTTRLYYKPLYSQNEKIVTVNTEFTEQHSVILTKLQPHTTYTYTWVALDENSQEATFTGNFTTF